MIMMRRWVVAAVAALWASFTLAQDLNYGEDEFVANFDIDSAHTTDGTNYKISASGEAGPYGRVWLSYEFTDKLGMGDAGEFTGFAWTQNGEEFATATLQGVYRRKGTIFEMYSLDMVSDGVINIVSGEADFVAKTMTFKVSPLK
tara:strand:+ start:157 stop:591 length:435 start_codon:yes stop_codon:yes gene_type:complete